MITTKYRARVILLHVLRLCILFIFPGLSFSQDTLKTIPDGTEGMVFVIRGVDSVTGKPAKLPPNEFASNGYSTMKVGLGYNHDFVNYAMSNTFRQQMDSAGL